MIAPVQPIIEYPRDDLHYTDEFGAAGLDGVQNLLGLDGYEFEHLLTPFVGGRVAIQAKRQVPWLLRNHLHREFTIIDPSRREPPVQDAGPARRGRTLTAARYRIRTSDPLLGRHRRSARCRLV
jgi:hypothetical protein